MTLLVMKAPTPWPFGQSVILGSIMPSGTTYVPDSSQRISVNPLDAGALLGYGFSPISGETQDVGTGASPTFAGLTVTGSTESSLAGTDGQIFTSAASVGVDFTAPGFSIGGSGAYIGLAVGPTTSVGDGFIEIDAYSSSGGPALEMFHGRGTPSSPSPTQSGDQLFYFAAIGQKSTTVGDDITSTTLLVAAVENFSTGHSAASLSIQTTDTVSETKKTRIFVDGTGNTNIQNGSLVLPGGTLLTTAAALTNGAGSSTGTLTNAPAVGNPTKWIPINDNGTTRYIPAW